MNSSYSRYLLALAFLMATSITSAQEASSDQNQAGRLPYEVIVTPGITRSDLRSLILEVEEDFFARFNEINIDDDYDIACYKYTPTMSHITERVCEPWFMIRQRGHNSDESMALMKPYGWDRIYLLTPDAMRKEIKPSYETLQEKMEALTKSDVEFRSIAEALLELKAQLSNFGNES